MRRSFAILIWILLGALAASLGIGSVLLHARQERDALEEKLLVEQAQTKRLTEEHTQTIQEANRTVAAALRNASATRDLLNAVTQEQAALENATILTASPLAKRWPQTISFPLGISLRTPGFVITTSTDTVIQSMFGGALGQNWLTITRYDDDRAKTLIQSLTSPEEVNYRLNQTLLTGSRGITSDGSFIFILHTQRRGVPTHLIWAKVTGSMTEERILDSLSTLLFATT